MPYTARWYIESEIIYVHYYGPTGVDEFRNSLLEIRAMIENSPRQMVHIINDVGDVTQPIAPKDALRVVREVGSPERSGWSLLVREKSLLVKMGAAFGSSLLKIRTRTFASLEEAETFLEQMDSTLDWSHADKSVIAG